MKNTQQQGFILITVLILLAIITLLAMDNFYNAQLQLKISGSILKINHSKDKNEKSG